MKRQWKRCLACSFAGTLVALLTGCGGVTASKSVSPATFLLPGLFIQTETPRPGPASIPAAATETAPDEALTFNARRR